jgi:cholesterol transport system auxiliary component
LQRLWPFIVVLLAGCSVVPRTEPVAMDRYLLETPVKLQGARPATASQVLLVMVPATHAGYDTTRMAYQEEPYALRYFTRSSWADTPPRMMTPLIADALEATGSFSAVLDTPGSVAAALRLDTDLLRFYQDFTTRPSEFVIAMRAQFVDLRTRRVIATGTFEQRQAAPGDDAYGGVIAANQAMARLLEDLVHYCMQNPDLVEGQ